MFHHINLWGHVASCMFYDVHVWRHARPRQYIISSSPAVCRKVVVSLAVGGGALSCWKMGLSGKACSSICGLSQGTSSSYQYLTAVILPWRSTNGSLQGTTYNPTPRLTLFQNARSPAHMLDCNAFYGAATPATSRPPDVTWRKTHPTSVPSSRNRYNGIIYPVQCIQDITIMEITVRF